MTDVRFYHLQQKRLEEALPELVGKALEKKHRILVKSSTKERVEALDGVLWSFDPASFIPHSAARDGTEKDQPVFLTTEEGNPNGATVLILTGGASADDLAPFSLCCDMFDGNDEQALDAARARWKQYKDKGHGVEYWQQDDSGKWQKKETQKQQG
jgi:DNA polymerase III subunit chi